MIPVISLCIPTHHGRAACLDRLLSSIAVQLGDDTPVEVCVSDNGSRDATAEVLDRHRVTFGERLRSRRSEHNQGMAPNMLASVEMARGEYAWLLGSDDALLPDAIATILELLRREPDLTGVSVAFVRRLGEQLEVPSTPVQAEWFPTDRTTTVYETTDRIIDACGGTPLAMSATIVRRNDWQAVVDRDPHLVRHAPTVPQVLITSLMWQRAPRWAWYPRPLVLSCAERVYLDERREMGPDKIRQLDALSRELDHVWAGAYGRFSSRYKRLMYRWYRIIANADQVLASQLIVTRSMRDDARNLAMMTRAFWWIREFRSETLPVIAVPSRVLRRIGSPLGWSGGIDPGACRTTVEVTAPETFRAGFEEIVRCDVANHGSARLHSDVGPNPVWLGARWSDAATGELRHGSSRARLHGLRPGDARCVALRVEAPPEPGDYRLQVAPVQEHVQWFDDIDPANGWSGIVHVAGRVNGLPVPERQARGTESPALAAAVARDLPGLEAMQAELAGAPPLYRPSSFWTQLGSLHRDLLGESGFSEFKRSINDYYFQFRGHHARQLLGAALRGAGPRGAARTLTAKAADHYNVGLATGPTDERRLSVRAYAVTVAAMWEYAHRHDPDGLLEALEEPELGRPLAVHYRGRSISQDLCNSVIALERIFAGTGSSHPRTVLELGAGYGRIAWALLAARPGTRYVIADIPPALAIAQRYLTELFPERPSFRFRGSAEIERDSDELELAELVFLTPNQLADLPPLTSDLAISISSLHEMLPEQISNYLQLIDRHCDGHFYTMQWQDWLNPVDGVRVTQGDYRYADHWREVFARPHPLQRGFFEALYATGGREPV